MNALFIVEKDFLSRHVGVARVILYYAEQLIAEGVNVDFGFLQGNEIIRGQLVKENYKEDGILAALLTPRPWYDRLGKTSFLNQPVPAGSSRYSVSWINEKANPENYDVNLVTAPWVCYPSLPPLPRVVGVVYDLVPNLAAAGCIRLTFWEGLLDFAHEHDVGFRYYLANAERVICISEATRQDFLQQYETAPMMADDIVVDIPYEHKTYTDNGQELLELSKGNGTIHKVLLVNALDWRKNLEGIEAVLIKAAEKQVFELVVVGKERIPMPEVDRFITSIEDAGVRVIWWRHAGDKVLNTCYQDASVLLFPSLYEGLGLPILEAQSMGLPVITSNIASCPEVNINSELCFDVHDVAGMAEAIGRCIEGDSGIFSGGTLKDMQAQRSLRRQSFTELLILGGARRGSK